ncbi:MAG: FG-GAP-like repeat-containing protein [Planctomycetota bacterium]
MATFTGVQDEKLGSRIASAGDVNGDGRADWIVGSPNYSDGNTSEGRIILYYGAAGGPTPMAVGFQGEGEEDDAMLGKAIAAAGDVNGDGYDDFIVGAPGSSAGAPSAGAAWLYQGPVAPGASPAWILLGHATSGGVGGALAGAGDVNGDGYDDVLIRRDSATAQIDRVDLYLGSKNGLTDTPFWSAEGAQPGAAFGATLTGLGDVNGDSYDDFAIAEAFWTGVHTQEGRALVFLGSETGPAATADWTIPGGADMAWLGKVAQAGDVNGDGFCELLVASPTLGGGGTIRLYRGSPTGLGSVPSWVRSESEVGALFGTTMVGGGDVNGDGFDDVVIGAMMEDDVFTNEGKAYFYLGSAAGLNNPEWTATGGVASGRFGAGLALGDLDGDGLSDLLVGAPFQDGGPGSDSGLVKLYPANDGFGSGLLPRQGTAAAPVAAGNGVHDDTIVSRLRARSPHGRQVVQVQIETRPFGALFGGPAIDESTYQTLAPADTGVGGLQVVNSTGGLAKGGYHWRTRVLNNLKDSPWMPTSRWVSVNGAGLNSRHIRLMGKRHIFLPGDTLQVAFNEGVGQEHDILFDGLAGSKLKLVFPQTNTAMTTLLMVLDPAGEYVKVLALDQSSSKVQKAKVKLKTTGTHILRLLRITGTVPLNIATSRTIPTAGKPFSGSVKRDKTTGVALLTVLALEGAQLDAMFKPKSNFSGPMALIFFSPAGTAIDLTAGGYQQSLPDGSIQLTGVPLGNLGAYQVQIQGFAADNEKVKVTLTPTQPPAGSATVIVN